MNNYNLIPHDIRLIHDRIIDTCDQFRPNIPIDVGPDRSCKDERYSEILYYMLEKKISSGLYVGLGGKHGDHIIKILSPLIDKAIMCNDGFGKELSKFYRDLNFIYHVNGLCINLQFVDSDIFKLLKYMSQDEYYFANPIRVLDIDSNRWLREKHIDCLADILPKLVRDEMILALWNSYGRGRTKARHEELISKLKFSISDKLKISDIDCVTLSTYRNNRMSMYFKLFSIRRK